MHAQEILHSAVQKRSGYSQSLSWALGAGTLPKDLEYMASKPEQTILSDDVILTKAGYMN